MTVAVGSLRGAGSIIATFGVGSLRGAGSFTSLRGAGSIITIFGAGSLREAGAGVGEARGTECIAGKYAFKAVDVAGGGIESAVQGR